MQFRSNQFNIPIVTKNLIIINVLVFFATMLLGGSPKDPYNPVIQKFALFHYSTPYFYPWQIITHMFLHGGLMHLLFNMITLWMFGPRLEQIWGPKRFINFYLISGLGAAAAFIAGGSLGFTPTSGFAVGASGAIFGLLAAFTYYWPNTELYLMFIPVPIKAKYLVTGVVLISIYLGISQAMPGIAHFAHVGGAIAGFLLVLWWNKNNRNTFY